MSYIPFCSEFIPSKDKIVFVTERSTLIYLHELEIVFMLRYILLRTQSLAFRGKFHETVFIIYKKRRIFFFTFLRFVNAKSTKRELHNISHRKVEGAFSKFMYSKVQAFVFLSS